MFYILIVIHNMRALIAGQSHMSTYLQWKLIYISASFGRQNIRARDNSRASYCLTYVLQNRLRQMAGKMHIKNNT